MLRLAVALSFALGAAACTTAPGGTKSLSTEAASEPAAQAASPEEKKICRDLGTTGSYGPRHVCHTKEQWEKIDALS